MADASDEIYAKALARVDPRWDAAHTERALAGLHRRRARRRAVSVLAAAALLISGATLGASTLREPPGATGERAPHVATTEVPPDSEAERVVRLADGSQVVPARGAQVVVERVTDALVAVRIDRGAADVEVVPGLARRFEVRAGAITVTVLGTAFRVERVEGERARVSVERGHVDVAWAGGHADLVAGDEGTFPPLAAPAEGPVAAAIASDETSETSASDETSETSDDDARVAARSEHVRRTTDVAAASPSWRELARASRYDEAYVALGAPAERAREVGDAVEDLLLVADVARLSGHPAEALPWLEAVERDHASDPRAVLASFTRGRILMELGRPSDAARQLERVLAMEPGGSLAEDALARAALAHAAAGDDASAAALAERYLAAHPSGRWSGRMRAIGARGAMTR